MQYLLYCNILYCILLYYIVLYCILLYCTVLYLLYCTVLYCTVLYLLYCIVLYGIVLYCTYCTVLYCIVLYCTYCIVLYFTVFYSQVSRGLCTVFIPCTLCVFTVPYVYLLHYVCIAVLTLDAGLLVRSQYLEGPATGHLDTGFSWFPCVYKRMLSCFPRLQVATTCLSCSPPDLNFLVTFFSYLCTCKITTATG